MIFKKDNLKLGLVLGLFGPVVGFAVVYFLQHSSYSFRSFGDFLKFFFAENKMLTSIGSLSLLANAVLFTLYLNTRKDKTAKGIFAVTLIYGVGILLLKVFNK
jgi:hypothetical protein